MSRKLVYQLAGLVFVVVASYAIDLARHAATPGGGILLIAGALLGIFIHEGGHALVALLMGFRITKMTIGNVCVTRWNGRWIFLHVSALRARMFGSVVAFAPPSLMHSRIRWAAVAVAGSLANAVTLTIIIAMILLHVNVPYIDWRHSGSVNNIIGGLFAVSWPLMVIPLLRAPRGGVPSDGDLLRVATGESSSWHAWASLMTLLAANADGIRPKEWSAPVIREALGVSDHLMWEWSAITMAMSHALDCNDQETAKTLLARALVVLEQVGQSKTFPSTANIDVTYWAARIGDIETARTTFARIPIKQRTGMRFARARAALALAEGMTTTARTVAIEALRSLEVSPDVTSGRSKSEIEWLNTLAGAEVR